MSKLDEVFNALRDTVLFGDFINNLIKNKTTYIVSFRKRYEDDVYSGNFKAFLPMLSLDYFDSIIKSYEIDLVGCSVICNLDDNSVFTIYI